MKRLLLTFLILLLPFCKVFSCSCTCLGDCSFNVVSKRANFVALVKVISFDTYLNSEIMGYDGKMPYAMTVEIVKKYKGKEKNKRIRIWGDNGALCRPYLAHFKIGSHYLIAPRLMKEGDLPLNGQAGLNNYTFFACSTDYLDVDIKQNKAYGKYSNNFEKIFTVDNLEAKLGEKLSLMEVRGLYKLGKSHKNGTTNLFLKEIKKRLFDKSNEDNHYEKEVDLDEFEKKLFEEKINLDLGTIKIALLNVIYRKYIWYCVNIIFALFILFILFKFIWLRKKR